MNNLLTEWARLTLGSLADAGLRDVVVSPGSRSTPYIVAACNERRVRCHSVIDERAASFYALGIAKVTGAPVGLLCTSGSAAAHYYPAIVEADAAGLPLVVLSADRPVELQGCGAPQTIDQTKMFGERVRGYFEAGQPDATPGALRGLRRVLVHAVAAARGPSGRGPVHVNLRARKPLEPARPDDEAGRALVAQVDALLAEPPVYALGTTQVDAATVSALVALLRRHPRALVRCGPAALLEPEVAEAVFAFARATGHPVHAEAGSGVRHVPAPAGVRKVDGFHLVAWSLAAAEHPELVVHVGGTWLFNEGNKAPPAVEIALAAHGVVDPDNTARLVVRADVPSTLRAVASAITAPVVDAAWADRIVDADRKAREALRRFDGPREGALREGAVARALAAAMPAGAALVLGNSLPIRSFDLYCPSAGTPWDVIVQRGANGIDGHVALTAGIASAGDRPVVLHLGDVSLLHDLSSLVLARRSKVPLVVLVVQNGGGRIFEQLPLAGHALLPEGAWDLVTTPNDVDLGPVCQGVGVAHARCHALPELEAALAAAFARPGVTVVEAVTSPTAARDEQRELRSVVAAAVAS